MRSRGRHQDVHRVCADVALMEDAAAIFLKDDREEPCARLGEIGAPQ